MDYDREIWQPKPEELELVAEELDQLARMAKHANGKAMSASTPGSLRKVRMWIKHRAEDLRATAAMREVVK